MNYSPLSSWLSSYLAVWWLCVSWHHRHLLLCHPLSIPFSCANGTLNLPWGSKWLDEIYLALEAWTMSKTLTMIAPWRNGQFFSSQMLRAALDLAFPDPVIQSLGFSLHSMRSFTPFQMIPFLLTCLQLMDLEWQLPWQPNDLSCNMIPGPFRCYNTRGNIPIKLTNMGCLGSSVG